MRAKPRVAIKDATRSATAARATLVREGIYSEDGKLAPSYSEERKPAR